jgi:hypothetical protein
MKGAAVILLLLSLFFISSCLDTVAKIDFTFNTVTTTATYWGNFLGITHDLKNLIGSMNLTLFQSYITNSNIYGELNNNFFQFVKVSKGEKYDCSIYSTPVDCTF